MEAETVGRPAEAPLGVGDVSAEALVKGAQAAGLTIRAEGDRLVVRGPRSAEPLARTVLGRKAEVLAFLGRQELRADRPPPPGDSEPAPDHAGVAEEVGLPPRPPADAELIVVDRSARPCPSAKAFMWTWVGAPRWFYAADVPVPGHGRRPPGERRQP
jgi:hypothetical protein